MSVEIAKPLAVINGIPRYCPQDNYSESFGLQWNKFDRTQLNEAGDELSARRFFIETGWSPESLTGLDVLEVGSGAGRFTRTILQRTKANLYSVDYSNAVEANQRNNGSIAPERLHLAQASIYDLPYPPASFDRVFCLGVLQHTPDPQASIRHLADMVKPGGELVVDFYPIRGWWTKVHAKYLLRPITKRLPKGALLSAIKANAPWMLAARKGLNRARLGVLTRFIPLCDTDSFPPELTPEELREWTVLDTFDMLSPQYDQPQRVGAVKRMAWKAGLSVTFAGFVDLKPGSAAVVRAVREGKSPKAACPPLG